MDENDRRFESESLAQTTSFSQLLFADEVFDRSLFDAQTTPKMLCFGDFGATKNINQELGFLTETTTTTKSSVTCSDSSSSASSTNNNVGVISKSNTRKRNGRPDKETVQCSVATIPSRKTKSENPNKRKEKVGERIAALQQLVSPFGKTDTASVLHEAMGYIRFLQEQVQALCSPYLLQLQLQRFSSSEIESGGEAKKDLRSRGLCLVPKEFTEHVANDNGADLWSPVTTGHVISLPTKQ